MPNTTDERPGRTIRSVKIAFNIIDLLQVRGRMGVTELADELGHSKSTIHSHLRTLEDRKMIVREEDGYRLSLGFLDIANHVKEQIGNYDVIRDEVDTLAEETNEIAQFGIEEHGQVVYLHKATGDQAVETRSRVGTRAPMHSTSLGKVILAYLPAERTERIIESIDFEQFTPNTITSADELRDELDRIHDRGYSIDDEENIEGLRCVSAPVKNGTQVLGSVSVTGPSSRLTDELIHEDLSHQVQRAANVIELNTKFS
ncbi:IclR family transcriptional regulator [Halorussus sp. AFM4]|uniref:IclR family transcriptional regulator n=1 Tax=Halorussus sp. AFM4 TaxID=3421651 RepID=UPI003EB99B15